MIRELWTVVVLTSTFPLIATGLSKVPCMPRIADCGGLMIGVPKSDPKTPPFEMVKVPPSISSTERAPCRAKPAKRANSRST